MSAPTQQSSWFVKGGLDAFYFRRTPEGTVFTSPPYWMFGQGREYRVSAAQEAELTARLGRAYLICVVSILVGLTVALIAALPALPWLLDHHPFAAFAGIAFITAVPLLLNVMATHRTARSVLAGVPSTAAPRRRNFTSAGRSYLRALDMLPTWALVAFIVIAPFAFVAPVMEACSALASGQLSNALFPLLQIVGFSVLLVADVKLLRARRSKTR